LALIQWLFCRFNKGLNKVKKFILGLFLLLILAAGGLFIYVISIDWNQHKNKIADQIYNSTGKYVVFEGNVSFKIFPSPYLRAINAKIYNTKAKGEKPLLHVKNVNAELSLLPLVKGNIEIRKMVLDGVVVNVDWDDKGLNWQGDLSADQRQMMQDSKMTLNSMSFRNAKLNVTASNGEMEFTVDNLNGEVMAQNVFGPFRIEGNYLNNNVPQGFALTIGKMTDSMATTLNAVFTHPKSDSYIRFDGSFHTGNRVLNGNVVVESKRFSEFVNDNLPSLKLSDDYKKPLVAGFDLALNKQMINISNMVLKYDDTQGAGSVKIPNGNFDEPNITINFEFADLNLDPLGDYIKSFITKYSKDPFTLNNKMKIDANIKSMRSSFNGQNFKNLNTTFEINEKGLLLDNFYIILPGDTELSVKGNVYSYNDEVYYQSEVSANTENLMQLFRWLEMQPKATAASTYKKLSVTAKVVGNFDSLHVAPFKVMLDNTIFNGEAGMSLEGRKDFVINVNADTVNLDNYLAPIPAEVKEQSFTERMKYRFSKMGILNNFDITLQANANLVIYSGLPFEKVAFSGNLLQGTLEVEKLSIDRLANTRLSFTGNVKGFGQAPVFENMQFNIETTDLVNMIEKFGLPKADISYDRFYNLQSSGTINGSLNNFGINTNIATGELEVNYVGSVDISNEVALDGDIEVKYPEAVNLFSGLGIDYEPQASSLGLFSLKAKIKGKSDHMQLSSADISMGYTQLVGDVNYNFSGENKLIETDLRVNKIDVEKYLVRQKNRLPISAKLDTDIVTFIPKPVWSKEKIDYTPYENLNVKAKLDVGELIYKDYQFKKSKFNIDVKDGVVSIPEFSATYRNTPIKAGVVLTMVNDPTINLAIDIANANVSDFPLSGKVYGIKDGTFTTKINLNSKAVSEEVFVENLSGTIDFVADKTNVAGIDIKTLYDDISVRDKSDGFIEKSNSIIANGTTAFDKIIGKLAIKDGDFSIGEATMTADNLNINLIGVGSIKNWTMDVLFNIKHPEPVHLPGYSIAAKNSMANPDMSIDVSKLFNVYKSKEDQIVAEQRAAEEAEKTRLNQRASEQKKIAEDLIKSAQKKLKVEIDKQLQQAFSDESIKQYNDVSGELNIVINEFMDKLASLDSDSINQQNVDVLKDLNEKTLQKIETIKTKTDQIHLSDLQKQNAFEYDKVVKANGELKVIVEDYYSKVASYTTRLANIITDYTLENDKGYMLVKEEIDNEIKKLEQMNNNLVTARNLHQVTGTISEFEQLNADVKDALDKIVAGNTSLSEKIKTLDNLVSDKIAKEEEAYNKKVTEEENERLIKENTGSISVKRTGKKVTVSRDLEEIKEANEEISNETVKVIDFTKKKEKTENTNSQSSSGVVKKGRINR